LLAGWVSGDSRCHFLSPHAAAVEADAEGLDFVNLLATPTPMLAQDGHSYYRDETLLAFSGQVQASRNVYVNTLNTHAVLGTLALLNAHRPVYPLRFGPPDHSDDWSLFDWAAQCRRKNGLAVWVNAPHGGEALAAAILGKLDAIEFTPQSMPLAWCYKAWNAGLTLPLIGGSGKESNSVALGALRTYAKCDGTYVGWIEAVRRGESFITNGPLIELNVEGSQCTATALSASTLGKLELVADGRVVAFSENGRIEHTFTNIPGWVAARCVGVAFAHTSPQWLSSRPGNKVMFHIALSECREWCELRGQYADEKWRRQLLANLDAAARITANVTEESPQ